MNGWIDLKPFKAWCMQVLPTIFDESMSYYESLCKLVELLNNTMNNVDVLKKEIEDFESNVNEENEKFQIEINEEVTSFETGMDNKYSELIAVWKELQDWVTNYFNNLDVQEEINNKLDEMATNGSLSELIEPFMSEYTKQLTAINIKYNQQQQQINNLVLSGTEVNPELAQARGSYDTLNDRLTEAFQQYRGALIGNENWDSLTQNGWWRVTNSATKPILPISVNNGVLFCIVGVSESATAVEQIFLSLSPKVCLFNRLSISSNWNLMLDYSGLKDEMVNKYGVNNVQDNYENWPSLDIGTYTCTTNCVLPPTFNTFINNGILKVYKWHSIVNLGKLLVFTSADNLCTYFGTTSYISNNWTQPNWIKQRFEYMNVQRDSSNWASLPNGWYNIPGDSTFPNEFNKNVKNGILFVMTGAGEVPNDAKILLFIESKGNFIYEGLALNINGWEIRSWNKIREKYEINNQIWYALGDSLTSGSYSYPNETPVAVTNAEWSYGKRISDYKGWNFYNLGIPGANIDKIISDELPQVNSNATLITIMGFTNNYNGSTVLGSFNDEESTTVCGKLYNLLNSLATKAPKATIIFISSFNMSRGDNPSLETGYSLNATGSAGYTLKQFYEEMEKLCKKCGIIFINGTINSPINIFNLSEFLPDGVHPTKENYEIIAKWLMPLLPE